MLVLQLSVVNLEETFVHSARERKLAPDNRKRAEELMRLQANKKLVQHQLAPEMGKVILLKDLSNIATNMKKGNEKNNIPSLVKTLTDLYGILQHVFHFL